MISKPPRTPFFALTVLAVSISTIQSLFVKLTGINPIFSTNRLYADFSPGPEAVDSVEHLKIVATVTNTGDETLKVLNDPRGPLNKIPTDTFVMTDAKGAQPSFTGINLKYVPKTVAALEAYSILAPGESVVVEHDRKCHLGLSSPICCSIIPMHLVGHAYNFTASGAAVIISTRVRPSILSIPTPRY